MIEGTESSHDAFENWVDFTPPIHFPAWMVHYDYNLWWLHDPRKSCICFQKLPQITFRKLNQSGQKLSLVQEREMLQL